MHALHTSLLAALVLTTGCATAPASPQPVELRGAQSAPPAAKTPTEQSVRKVEPDHLLLIPNLASPDHVQTEIRHDFNGDGVLDLALVTVPPESRGLDGNEAERILTLGIRDGNAYRSVQSTECVALCPQCGGIMGDPYQGVDKGQDGSITVHNYGGSRHRWSVCFDTSIHARSQAGIPQKPKTSSQSGYGDDGSGNALGRMVRI